MRYIDGELLVIFHRRLTKEELEEFIGDYNGINLPYELTEDIKTGHITVIVPRGDEALWKEKLRQDKRVKTADYNYLKNFS